VLDGKLLRSRGFVLASLALASGYLISRRWRSRISPNPLQTDGLLIKTTTTLLGTN